MPRRLRQHVCNIYAYCRWADDLADETGDPAAQPGPVGLVGDAAPRLLSAAGPTHPVFIALAETIRKFDIPTDPFVDLLVAFRQDQRVTRYETIDQLLDYCRYSANPVGRLVLYLGECHTPERVRLADSICTGLQLANFCQDVARDWDRGRIYLPQTDCRRFGYDEAMFARRECNDAFRQLLAAQVEQAEGWLRGGLPLAAKMPPGLRLPVALFVHGGLATLEAIRRQDYDVWTPPADGFEAGEAALADRLLVAAAVRWHSAVRAMNLSRDAVETSYALLPADEPPGRLELSRGLPAAAAGEAAGDGGPLRLHAPHRRPGRRHPAGVAPTDPRRDALTAWRAALERALGRRERMHDAATNRSDPPFRRSSFALSLPPSAILPALADAVRRFHIPHEHLYAVIDGVEMDLDRRRYETFDELQQYCERVASAVGLACIHIWGFRGPEAFEPARQAGIALQLTNILRDLKEDAAAGRVYLPLADLRECDYSVDDLLAGVADERFHRLMALEVARAEQFYADGAELLDWLEPSGRRIFGLMMATYRALLRKIARRPADVFRRRVRLSRLEEASACRPLVAAAAAKGRLCDDAHDHPPWPIVGGGLAGLAAAVAAVERGLARRTVRAGQTARRPGRLVRRLGDRRADRLLPARRDGLLHRVSRLLPPHRHRRLLRAVRHAALHRARRHAARLRAQPLAARAAAPAARPDAA